MADKITPIRFQKSGKLMPLRKGMNEVVTIVLSDTTADDQLNFHCPVCGRILFNYYSPIRIIIAGEMREVSRPLDIMCAKGGGCKTVFRIV